MNQRSRDGTTKTRPTGSVPEQRLTESDPATEETLRQIGRCAFGIVYPGDDKRLRTQCPAGGGCSVHGSRANQSHTEER